jgi:hypothetical protein
MKIYVCHSSAQDYKTELYGPIRKSHLNDEHEFIFPHEFSSEVFNSKEIMPSCDLIIAEVSYPSTGMGIELGWAEDMNKKILCIHKSGCKVSHALKRVTLDFIEYKDSSDLVAKLASFMNRL